MGIFCYIIAEICHYFNNGVLLHEEVFLDTDALYRQRSMHPVQFSSMSSIHVIYASGSGHTEYVVTALASYLQKQSAIEHVTLQLAETAKAADLLEGDVLILGSGTWNTGGVEGQLHPYMYQLLQKEALAVDLSGKRCTHIALGDERYYYTARSGEYMRKFLVDHGGTLCCSPLTIINEPYGQEEKIVQWGEKFLSHLSS